MHARPSPDWHPTVGGGVDLCPSSTKHKSQSLCFAATGEAGTFSSLMTLCAAMESFMVDLMHICLAAVFNITLQCIVMIPLTANQISFILNSDFCPLTYVCCHPRDEPKPGSALTAAYSYSAVPLWKQIPASSIRWGKKIWSVRGINVSGHIPDGF